MESLVGTLSVCLFAFLIFDSKWRFYKWYSLCFVAVFANFQNGLIFGILADFSSPFLHGTTRMCCKNLFREFFLNFSLLTQSDHFAKAMTIAWWPFFQFLEWSHFSKISCKVL